MGHWVYSGRQEKTDSAGAVKTTILSHVGLLDILFVPFICSNRQSALFDVFSIFLENSDYSGGGVSTVLHPGLMSSCISEVPCFLLEGNSVKHCLQ